MMLKHCNKIFNSKIIDCLKLFGLLLHKCWLVRKKQWITMIFGEIVIPVILIYCGWAIFQPWRIHLHTVTEKHYDSLSLEQLINQTKVETNQTWDILYAPSNPFIDELMLKFGHCLQNSTNVTKFKSESHLVAYFIKNDKLSGTWKKVTGVVFDDHTNESTNHLRYTLRPKHMILKTLYNSLLQYNMTAFYMYGMLVQMQICLDESFVKMKIDNVDVPQIHIQQMPCPGLNRDRKFIRENSINFILAAFAIPLFIETLKASKEKFVGINVLMSTNGIPNSLNLLSWITSGIVLLSIFCVISVLCMVIHPAGYSNSFLNYGNPIILLIVFICHIGHSITYGIHVSSYFFKSVHLIYALITVNALAIILRGFILAYVNIHLTPYVGVLVPLILLHQALLEIDAYEAIGIGVQWDNMFINTNPEIEIGGTVGMIIVLSVIGMILHFLLAIYIYAIYPGKSGIGKHPLFFLMYKRKVKEDNDVKNLTFDDLKDKYFEPTSTDRVCTPGIQIRNLTKAYDISIYNKEKVHALRNVSVDFYKGQITSLLGHNGAGKSTLMAILTGSISPTDGLILIDSKNLKDNACEILQDIGIYAQDNMYFPNLTVTEQLDFFAMIKRKNKSRSVINENVTNLMKKLKIYNVKDCLPNKLCDDQKRKLCLGMAFVGDPSTLILDEPTSCMNHENKHLIWDIILEMRGRKTILISTHDMEEADILGDRIAIMHEGRLKSYGTSLFLKKMIGGQHNIDVTITIERWSEPEKIRVEIHQDATIVEREDKKIIVSAPISSTLSRSLNNIERKKKELGISDYSLSHVGLEQVFLKVADDNDSHVKSYESFPDCPVRLKGTSLYLQSIKALFIKKLTCATKDLRMIIKQIFMVFMSLLSISIGFTVSDILFGREPEKILMRLDIYDNVPYTFYTSSDESLGDKYKCVARYFGAESAQIVNETLEDGLLRYARQNLVRFNNFVIAAAEFKKTTNHSIANAFYSETVSFSLPISINLVWNAIAKNLIGRNYSISMSGQSLPYIIYPGDLERSAMIQGYTTAIFFVIPFYFAVAMFAVHPSRESCRGIKKLQKMTGVSGFTYWATTFIIDLMQYSFLVVLIVIGLLCMDYCLALQLYETNEILIMIMLLMLFGINVLPLIYIVSFVKMKTSNVLKFVTFIPIALVIIECVILIWKHAYEADDHVYSILRTNCLLLPYASFIYGQEIFQMILTLNAFCRRLPDEFYEFQCKNFDGLCCEEHCHGKECQKLLSYFSDSNVDNLNVTLIYLCSTPLLYFGILGLLEAQVIQKLLAKCTRQTVPEPSMDEQVQLEKTAIIQKIQEINDNRKNRQDEASSKQFFLAYELRKHFRKIKAVDDVSFMIKKGECFGLYGINRSGKSMTFKMMTGEEIADHGVMYIGDKDFKNYNKYFLSQIGYCPQYDASLKCLNSHDHLQLIARLRGIPEQQIQTEVDMWIERLNLSRCASQPSGTYSSGNKQRLNIAMALIGNPKLVLLDEPTTRMDPGARRLFWNTIKSCQIDGQTFMLTSHNMEECETLCNRMAIMLDGKLICIGTPRELKHKFGAGYDVQIRLNARKAKVEINKIKNDMRLLLHCVLANENTSFLLYHVVGAGTTWRKIYEVMNVIRNKYDCIDDFLVIVRLST